MGKAINRTLKCLLLTLFILIGQQGLYANPSSPEKLRFELLTCSPGKQVYELYGHTALRVSDGVQLDEVYNYGVFDFNQPHFVWNFVLGKTDYMLASIPFPVFMYEYQNRGSSVVSQTINLTPAEARKLYDRITRNALPANRIYRYNYLTNNCTTRVRDIIEGVVEGEVVYKESEKDTYRAFLHQYTADHPWAELGNDMLLGADVDTILTDRSSSFLPDRLMAYYNLAMIYDHEGNSRPLLVGKAVELLPKRVVSVPEEEFPLPPMTCALLFVAFCYVLLALEYRLKRVIWGIDFLLMIVQGLAGCLIAFMFFFSEHPAVGSNWMIWVLNPLPLLCMPWVLWRAIKHERCYYHPINIVVLLLFLLFSPWLSQDFPDIIFPVVAGLLTRPVSYYLYYGRKEEKVTKAGAKEEKKKKKKK